MIPKIIGVQSDEIDQYWSLMEKWISDACEYSQGRYDAESIRQALKNRSMQCWLGVNGVLVTQVINYPLKKICFIMFFGGDNIDGLKNALDYIEDWARVSGCDGVEVTGRRAWAKLLPGYQCQYFLTREV